MKGYMDHKLACAMFAVGLLASMSTNATPLNIDFSLNPAAAVPGASFGAASGQVGVWNNISALNTPAGIVDLSGAATGVAINITTSTNQGTGSCLPAGDGCFLMQDNFFSVGGASWILSITGLTDGLYDVYLYEPHNQSVGTGSGNVNGSLFSNINGNFDSGVFVLNSNYHLMSSISVTGGMLSATGAQPGTFSGLAGLQIVQAESVPVPSSLTLIGLGLAGVGYKRKRKTA